MWCPDGYVTFSAMKSQLAYIVWRYNQSLRFTQLISNPDGLSGVPKGYEKDFEQLRCMLLSESEVVLHEATLQLFSVWLLDATFFHFPVYVCSRTGIILEVSSTLCMHDVQLSQFEWNSLNVPLELQSLMSIATYEYHPMSIWDGFETFDLHTGIVIHKRDNDHYFSPRKVSRYVADQIAERRLLSEYFEGWAICFKRTDIPDDEDEILSTFGFDHSLLVPDELDHEERKDWKRRQPADDTIVSCTLEAYPDGKTDSWIVVQKKVGYSRRSIVRAMKGRADWWLKEAGQA